MQALIKQDIKVFLEQEVMSFDGFLFKPSDDIWILDPTAGGILLHKAKLCVNIDDQPWLVAALSFYAKYYATRTLNSLVRFFSRCSVLKLNPLDENNLVAIREWASKTAFSSYRTFMKKWLEEYPLSVTPSKHLVEILFKFRLKGNKGPCPIESMNPDKGPFTTLEKQAVFDWVNDSYIHNKLPIEQYVCTRILIFTGSRIHQLQQLIFDDIKSTDKGIFLLMPLAKKKGKSRFRDDFSEIKLSPDLYDLLVNYKNYVYNRLMLEKPGVNWKLAMPNVPLFRAKSHRWHEIIEDPNPSVLEYRPNEAFHKNDSSMRLLVSRIENSDGAPISERTGKPIHLSSHRFRYTLGTDMARMGYSPHAIASALGHSDTRTIGRYIKTSAEMGERINEKIRSEIALVANAFQGRIVRDRTEAVNGDLTHKIIRSRSGELASCGALGGCHLDAPVACYTCSKFQPLVDGPHEEVLERLLLKQKKTKVCGNDSLATISFDRAIMAVTQVIESINEFKKKNN